MYVGSFGYLVLIIFSVLCVTINSTMKMFCRLSSVIISAISFVCLYILYLAILCIHVSLISCGGRKEPFVYKKYC